MIYLTLILICFLLLFWWKVVDKEWLFKAIVLGYRRSPLLRMITHHKWRRCSVLFWYFFKKLWVWFVDNLFQSLFYSLLRFYIRQLNLIFIKITLSLLSSFLQSSRTVPINCILCLYVARISLSCTWNSWSSAIIILIIIWFRS